MSKAAALQKRPPPLPSKEASLFKELLTLYETRQIKKGLKTAEQILKKFPEHGETLCMKGLVLTHMGKRDDGIDLVKKGVRLDLTSHICWHVFGLIQKADKNYEEALKSYTQALRFDKENMNLLRDSAQLQTHLRLYESLVDTRYTIVKLRPNHRQNWVALAVAHHLNGNLNQARTVLEHYQRSLKNIPDYDPEHSETLLYYISILEDMGELSAALTALDSGSKARTIVDRTAILKVRARILSKQNSPDAQEAWRDLIQHNPDNLESYHGYLSSQGLSLSESSTESLSIIQDLAKQHPRASLPPRLTLDVCPAGPEFKDFITTYLTRHLKKGVPSLFADLKALYADKNKKKIIEDVVESLLLEYTPPESPPKSGDDVEPTTYLWTLYYLAQHYACTPTTADRALSLLTTALSHTPTLPELHLLKGRILKRCGDPWGAARCANDARLLDGQDRFLNTKCGKYFLRAGMLDEAEDIFGMFTKKDAASPSADLEEMQSLLFLLESASAFLRPHPPHLDPASLSAPIPSASKPIPKPQPQMALKRYIAVKKVFDELDDDQYDFHGYNLRKFTMGVYVKLLVWENNLRSHPSYVKAVVEATKIFVMVSDNPKIVTDLSAVPTAQLTDAEKKAKQKARKAAKKALAREEIERGKMHHLTESANKDLEAAQPKDDDPDGMKLLGCSDPLEQAHKLLHPLTSFTLTDKNVELELLLAIYDVEVRRKKLLQACRALSQVVAASPEHPEVHVRLVDIKLRALELPQTPPAPIGPVFLSSVAKLVPELESAPSESESLLEGSNPESSPMPRVYGLSPETYNSQYLQRHIYEPKAILAAARVMKALKGSAEQIQNTVFLLLEPNVEGLDITTSFLAVETLISVSSSRVHEFREACQVKFPLSTVFKGSEDVKVLRDSVMQGTPVEDVFDAVNGDVEGNAVP